jgi:hypothetical protein
LETLPPGGAPAGGSCERDGDETDADGDGEPVGDSLGIGGMVGKGLAVAVAVAVLDSVPPVDSVAVGVDMELGVGDADHDGRGAAVGAPGTQYWYTTAAEPRLSCTQPVAVSTAAALLLYCVDSGYAADTAPVSGENELRNWRLEAELEAMTRPPAAAPAYGEPAPTTS